MNRIEKYYLNQGQDNDWNTTISGQIYQFLENKLQETELFSDLSVSHKGEPIEFFHYQKQHARLVKHLEGGASTGSVDATMKAYVEAWEYCNLDWWRQALDSLSLVEPDGPIGFLPVPVVLAANDAGIVDCESIFLPEGVIKQYGLEKSWKMKNKINELIRSKVEEVLQPHCRVIFDSDFNRIIPVSRDETAISILKPASDIQIFIRQQIQSIVPELGRNFQSLRVG